MKTTPTTWRTAIGFAAVALTTCLAGNAPGQDTLQTGDGLLSLSAAMPAETRIGEEFSYAIRVTNTSDNVTLHDIELKQQKAKGFRVESTSMQGQQPKQKQQGDGASNEAIKIDTLEPGESRTIQVTATADEEGELRSCLAIVNYVPSLCLTSKVIKPELELTKVAPARANRCEVIELEYAVKNSGSGDVGSFTITDSLGEGLATIEGEGKLQFQVDGLKAGDTRKFLARVYAERSGNFSSRAVAEAKDSDLSSRSKQTTTEVVAADLNVEVEGPNRLYGDQLARFTARVTNTGNAPAEDVRVAVMWPEATSLVDVGEFRMQQASQQDRNRARQRQQKQGQPTELTFQQSGNQKASDQKSSDQKSSDQKSSDQKSSDQKSSDQPSDGDQSVLQQSASQQLIFQQDRNQQAGNQQAGNQPAGNQPAGNQQQDQIDVQMRQDELRIERLEPGQTAVFEYAVRPRGVEELPTRVVATTVCTVAAAEDEARSEITAMAMARAKIVRLPALQIVVLDDEDPVQKESEVVYSIRVWNEGDAKDSQVELEVELPEGLELVSAQGPTEENVEGSTITFEPIETLNPGDRADFKVTAKSTGEGEVRFTAKLKSEALKDEVTSEEPTTLFNQQAQN